MVKRGRQLSFQYPCSSCVLCHCCCGFAIVVFVSLLDVRVVYTCDENWKSKYIIRSLDCTCCAFHILILLVPHKSVLGKNARIET